MKKLALILLAMAFISCSNDDDTLKNPDDLNRYERKLINGERTGITRGLTDTNAYCGEVTESGIEELPEQNATYQWVVVCVN